jgi:hypothetical protein
MDRNPCPEWIGMVVRNESESLSGMGRNTQAVELHTFFQTNANLPKVQQDLKLIVEGR